MSDHISKSEMKQEAYLMCIHNKDNMSVLQINNTNGSDPCSYEVTAVTNKAQKKFWDSNGIQTHDLCDTGTMLYWLSYEALLEAGRVWVNGYK